MIRASSVGEFMKILDVLADKDARDKLLIEIQTRLANLDMRELAVNEKESQVVRRELNAQAVIQAKAQGEEQLASKLKEANDMTVYLTQKQSALDNTVAQVSQRESVATDRENAINRAVAEFSIMREALDARKSDLDRREAVLTKNEDDYTARITKMRDLTKGV